MTQPQVQLTGAASPWRGGCAFRLPSFPQAVQVGGLAAVLPVTWESLNPAQPNQITELTARAKMLCLYLHDRANGEGESWYAIGTIAQDLALSRSTVKRALGDLVRLGRVERLPRYRENGGQTSNLYRLRK